MTRRYSESSSGTRTPSRYQEKIGKRSSPISAGMT